MPRIIFVALIVVLAIGCVVAAYAKSVRQEKARHLLDESDLPFLEVDPHPAIQPPAGYRAYLARDWDRYMVVQAESVTIWPDSPTGKDLWFEYAGGDDILTVRRPRYPGELSHLFLPMSVVLPDEVARLRARPVPTVLTAPKPKRRMPVRFREEPLPAGAEPGSKAYRGEFVTFVYSGIVTGITGKPEGGFTFNPGSDVTRRTIAPGDPNSVSHIIVPPGYSLPPEFIERSRS